MTSVQLQIVTDRPERFAPAVWSLRKLGIRSTIVAPGPTALVVAKDLAPDVTVIDSHHPGACSMVMLLERLPCVGMVLVLADSRDETTIDRCLLAGAADVLADESHPEDLAWLIFARIDGIPRERAAAMASRRRAALGRLAAVESRRPGEVTVRLTALERSPAPKKAPRVDPLEDVGPAQRRLIEGVRAGRSGSEIARAAGVSPAAVYGARRRLARRLDVTVRQLAGALHAPAAV